MKKILSLILICMLGISGISARAEAETIIYVSPDGNDGASGTADKPLATLEGARIKVRSIKSAAGKITVYFREGEYLWKDTVKFDAADSGTADSPVRYCAYPGETVIFTGGMRIDGNEFSLVTDENVLSKINAEVAEYIRQINIRDYFTNFKNENGLGETYLMDWYPLYGDVMSQSYSTYDNYRTLYRDTVFKGDLQAYNDYMSQFGETDRTGSVKRSIYSVGDSPALWQARYPNKEVKDGGAEENPYPVYMKTGASSKDENGKGIMKYTDDRISRYADCEDVWLEHYGTVFYHDMLKIESIDSGTKTLKTAVKPTNNWRENADFCIFNALGELDAPGEMYIDKNTGMMYIYPNGDLDNSYMNAAVFTGEYMIETTKTSFVEFKGITFENTQGGGISINCGDSVSVNYCDFLNIGNQGVVVGSPGLVWYWQLPNQLDISDLSRSELIEKYNGFYNGEGVSPDVLGKNHRLCGLKIKNTGTVSVSITGGNSWRDEECNYTVENCDISYPGIYKPTYVAAISLNNVFGIKILNNILAHAPSQLIYGSLLKGEIANNDIYDAMSCANDNGMIYLNYTVMGLDIDIHNNRLRQIPPDNKETGKTTERFGIYFDNGVAQGLKIRNNIFMNMTSALQKPVINSDVTGNVFVDCTDIHSKYTAAMWGVGTSFMYPAASEENFYKAAENECLTKNLPAGTREWENILTILPVFGDGETGEKYTKLWQKKYPTIMQYLDIVQSQRHKGDFFVNVRDNLIVNTDREKYGRNGFIFEDMRQYTPSGCVIDNNIYTDDTSCFVDYENNNLAVKPSFAVENNLIGMPDMEAIGNFTAKTGAEFYRGNGTLPAGVTHKESYADGIYKVKTVSASKRNVVVTFDEEVGAATANVFELSPDSLRRIQAEDSEYSNGELILKLGESLDTEKQYEILVKFGENCENTYRAWLKFDILTNEKEYAGGIYSLENDTDLHNKYKDYTVEFTCAEDTSIADVVFYADENYNKEWNYHGAVGATLSTNKAGWKYYDNNEAFGISDVSDEVKTSISNYKNMKISASVAGKNLFMQIYDSYGNHIRSLKAKLPKTESEMKYSFGTFGISTSALQLTCYRSVVYGEEYPVKNVRDIPFEKNADTVAKMNTEKITAEVEDIEGNVVKTIETDYADIDRESWFAGIPDKHFNMYISGLKSSFFGADGRITFSKLYREDDLDENGTLIGSKLCRDSETTYEMYIPPQGFEAKEKDAVVLINDPAESYHTPSLTVDLNKTATSAVRFATQVNADTLHVSVKYTDGTTDEADIATQQSNNMTYSAKWKDYHKYFATEDETVQAGIIGSYGRANGQAIYPNTYRSEYANNADYCASVNYENTVAGDIRISEKGIRYYEPQIFLLEMKTDTKKIPESMTISVNAARPTVIYSIAQCEETATPKLKDFSVAFEKNADTVAVTDAVVTVDIEDTEGNSKGKATVSYASVNPEKWFNNMPANKYHMYFSGLSSAAFPEGVAEFKGIYREDELNADGELCGSKIVYDSDSKYKIRIDGGKADEKDAFLLRNKEGEAAHAPQMTAALNKVPTECIRFAAQTSLGSIKAEIKYTDGEVQTNNIETNYAGNAVYSGYWQNYSKYFAEKDEEVSAGIIAICDIKNGMALYPHNYYSKIGDNNADYCATKNLENTVSADIRISEGRIRYYNPKLFLFEIKTDSSKIPESITLSANNDQPTLIYSLTQHSTEAVGVPAQACDIGDDSISVAVSLEEGSTAFLAMYGKNGALLKAAESTEEGIVAANDVNTALAERIRIFIWENKNNIIPMRLPIEIKY